MGEILQRGAPARRAQRRVRRRRAGPVDDRPPDAAQGQLHRVGGDRQAGRGRRRPRPEAGHARARRQRPGDRARRRRPRRDRREAVLPARSTTAARSARRSSGCTCPRRSTTTSSTALAGRARPAKVGDGMEPETRAGPDQEPPAVRAGQRAGRRRRSPAGASAATGGAPIDGPGYFFQPTMLTGAAEGTRIVDEEQFGPALPVIPYRDVDDVVERANATNYGLSGSVWSADVERGRRRRRAPRVRHRVGQRPRGPRPPPAVRRLQVERARRGERPLGPGRLHRAAGPVPSQGLTATAAMDPAPATGRGAATSGPGYPGSRTRACSPATAPSSTTSCGPGMLHACFVRSPFARAPDRRHRHVGGAGAAGRARRVHRRRTSTPASTSRGTRSIGKDVPDTPRPPLADGRGPLRRRPGRARRRRGPLRRRGRRRARRRRLRAAARRSSTTSHGPRVRRARARGYAGNVAGTLRRPHRPTTVDEACRVGGPRRHRDDPPAGLRRGADGDPGHRRRVVGRRS